MSKNVRRIQEALVDPKRTAFIAVTILYGIRAIYYGDHAIDSASRFSF